MKLFKFLGIYFSHPTPKVGDEIEITWLPNPRNNPSTKSCYIGSKGIVEKVYTNKAFDLRLKGESGQGMLLIGKRYQYKKIS